MSGLFKVGKGNKRLGEKLARHIEHACELPEYWLDGLAHVVRAATPPTNEVGNALPARSAHKRVPVITNIEAGNPREAGDAYLQCPGGEELITDAELGAHAFGLTIHGDSMAPEFKEGDRVVIDPDVLRRPGDFVVAKSNGGEVTFKKYRSRGIDEQGNEVFELVSLNEDYPTLRLDQLKWTIVGTMVEHRRYRRR